MKQSKIEFNDIKGMLSRDEMKKIKGGDLCTVTNTGADGSSTTWNITFGAGWSCSGMSSYAGGFASSAQQQNGGSTHYDCGCDGWGT